MKFFKNRLAVGIMCIILSLAIGIVGIPFLNASENGKTNVVRLKTDVTKGTRMDEGMLEVVRVGKLNLPSSIAKTKNEVKGLFALSDMVSGEYIFQKKVSRTQARENEYLYTIPTDKMAVSITIKSFAAGLSGKLLPQDIVTVFSVQEVPKIQGQVITDTGGVNFISTVPHELKYVEVLSVTNPTGTDTDKAKLNEKDNSEATKELPATVTLLVNQQQAGILTALEKKGNVHLALVSRGNIELKNKLIAAQEKLFQLNPGVY